jgi:uncharacterized membrane protein YkvA (DUF1232 family)
MPLRGLPRYLLTGRFLQVFLHLPEFVRLYVRLFRDPRVSRLAKAWLVIVGLYVVSPIDLVPAWLLGLGQLDDVVLALGGLWLFVRLCPPEVVREHVIAIGSEGRR